MYTWSFYEEGNFNNGDFDTIEECIQEARLVKKSYKLETEVVYIGKVKPYSIYCSVEHLLEQVEESAYDAIGEYAEDWYTFDPMKDKEDLEKLKQEITKLVTEFLEKNNNLPHFYYINNVKAYNLNTGKLLGNE